MPRPSPLRLLTLAAALLLVSAAARAEDQPLTYRLLSDDRPIGSRETALTYLPGPSGEIRMLKAWTTLVLPTPREAMQVKQRLGARFGGDRSFSVSLSTNGQVREIQGRQEPDGTWTISIADAQGAKTWSLESSAVDLSSPELLDPERALSTLRASDHLRLLSAETGAILEGPVEALPPRTVAVADRDLPVEVFRFSPPEGSMTLAYSQEGWLVAYDYQILGKLVGARLEKLPPPRSFDTALDAPLTGGQVLEDSL
ncbi:MAG: hypothetical protein ABIO70_20220 [Pseudomonadota bacterium]